MARKKGLGSVINAVARDMARAQRRAEAERKRKLRTQQSIERSRERERKQFPLDQKKQALQLEKQKQQRQAQTEKERKQLEKEERLRQTELDRQQKLLEKEAQEQYLADRLQETEDSNSELADLIEELKTILEHTLTVDDTIAFDSLRIKDEFPSFTPPQELTLVAIPPKQDDFVKRVKPMGLLENALGMKGRYQREIESAKRQFAEAFQAYEAAEAEKKAKLEQLRKEYGDNRKAFFQKVQQRDQEVSLLEQEYQAGDPSAVMSYTTMVLERSEYSEGFPQSFRLAYVPESQEMVIEYELPGVDLIPTVVDYKYNKTKDEIEVKTLHKAADIKALYQDMVTAITLRTIHEVLEADQGNHIQVVVFNGFVNTVDPATGNDIRPCLVSVRTTKETFSQLNLSRIDKQVCLRNLGAKVSARPDEKLPVKPVVEFEMVDKRFVDQEDILSGLDARPNLMDLSPNEFENLVSNLFGKMGLETKLTRASKDGGVDAVAFDTRPILGGKVVIQAKRYKNVVGVSAVRDLYGTMLNEGASKGIIVATSNYGPDAYEFCKDKPLELIDGGGLLYLLDQVGIQAKIIMPQE